MIISTIVISEIARSYGITLDADEMLIVQEILSEVRIREQQQDILHLWCKHKVVTVIEDRLTKLHIENES